MHPANTELARIDLGSPALRWPGMEPVTISLASPDETGAVAYYFDTLDALAPNSIPTSTARAACEYLLGLIRGRSLQLTRGPFVIPAPDVGPVPDGFRMIRAVAWVEEFDLVVPEADKVYAIRVNGSAEVEVENDLLAPPLVNGARGCWISYDTVRRLAGISAEYRPTVTFRRGAVLEDGILQPGGVVAVRQKGTVFDVAITSGA